MPPKKIRILPWESEQLRVGGTNHKNEDRPIFDFHRKKFTNTRLLKQWALKQNCYKMQEIRKKERFRG